MGVGTNLLYKLKPMGWQINQIVVKLTSTVNVCLLLQVDEAGNGYNNLHMEAHLMRNVM